MIIKSTQIFREFNCFKKILIFYVLIFNLTFHFKHFSMTQKLFGFGSFFLIVNHQSIDKSRKLFWVRSTYFLVFSDHDFFVKFIRCLGSEWRLLHCHFIQNTSQWPNITLIIIRFFTPNLRRSVIRSSCLSNCERIFQMFSDIEISYFSNSIMEKDICWFYVPVDNVWFMKFK